MVVDIFWLMVGGGGDILAGSGWWMVVSDCGRWWMVGGGIVQFNPYLVTSITSITFGFLTLSGGIEM